MDRNQLLASITENTEIDLNLRGVVFVTSEDRVRAAFYAHLHKVEASTGWIAPLGLASSLALAVVTADFRHFGFPASTWQAIFVVGGVVSVIWLIVTLFQRERKPTVADLIYQLRLNDPSTATPQVTSQTTAIPPTARPLVGSPWTLVFNPAAQKSKPISFEEGGSIGAGRNKNEFTWRMNGDALEILNHAGEVHSRFRRDGEMWRHANDPDTGGPSRDQRIEPA